MKEGRASQFYMLLSPLTGVRDKLTPVGGDNAFTSHLFKLLVIIRGVAFLVNTASPELNLWTVFVLLESSGVF